MKVRFAFWILCAVLSTWSTLQALCVSLSLNVWGRLEWTFWTQVTTKGMLFCKKYWSAWWVWLRGVSRGGDPMEEDLHEFFTHLSSFGGVYVLFPFHCLLLIRKPFYSLLSNFPWLHACYKVFSWNVIAGQDSLELASLHLELFPWLQAVPVPAELLWHRELMGEVVVPGGFCDFCCLGAEALARFSGKLVLWCSCGHSLQYQL